MTNTDRFSGVTYLPSDKILGKIRISVNPQCFPSKDGEFSVIGNWLSNTEEMSEETAIKIARNLIKKGCAVNVVPQYTSNNFVDFPNPSPTGKWCYWEWRSFDGEDFEFVLFEVG